MKFRLLAVIFFIFFFPTVAWSLNDETHPIINELVAKNKFTVFDFDSYLKNQLGFNQGRNEVITAYNYTSEPPTTIYEWLGKGGKYEDKPPELFGVPARSLNHFHNPLAPTLDDAALEMGFWSKVIENPPISYDNYSALQWAQLPAGAQSLGGSFSWQDARGYFYNALTAGCKTDRDNYFVQTRDTGDMLLVGMSPYGAVCDLRTIRNGEEYSFQVLFIQDKNGVWRVKNF